MKQPYPEATFYGLANKTLANASFRDMTWGFHDASNDNIWVRGSYPYQGATHNVGVEFDSPLAIIKGSNHVTLDAKLSTCASLDAATVFYRQFDEFVSEFASPTDVILDFRDRHQLRLPFKAESELDETNYVFQLDLIEFERALSRHEPTFREGALSRVTVNRYERNDKARSRCIEHYGAACFYCHFDFHERYGQAGWGVIQVHHIFPISKGERETDPIADLRPICPNCHVVIHRREPPYDEDEMRAMLRGL